MSFASVIEDTGKVIDAAGVAAIAIGAVVAGVTTAIRLAHHETHVYERFREQLGRAVLLGLELLVAADIIRTVAVTPTLTRIGVLAGIVVIRTFLSFSLEVEITGAWPWQHPHDVRPGLGEPVGERAGHLQ